MSSPERRRNPRLGMAIAVRVQGYLPGSITWEETTQTEDVSPGGAAVALVHAVELGQALHLTLAMPARLRLHDAAETAYRVYALVRRSTRRANDHRVGLMFFGKFPPKGFHEAPWGRFLLPSDSESMATARADAEAADAAAHPAPAGTAAPTTAHVPAGKAPSPTAADQERRTHPRIQLFLNFTIQQVDEWGVVLQEELTVADNLSKGGAHVLTTLDFGKGDVVVLREAEGGFATRAEVRAAQERPDGITLLHLKFLDGEAPEHLLKS